MPNTRSAKKRLRQTEKRRTRNKNLKTQAKSQFKKFEAAIAAGDVEAATQAFREAASKLDKVAGQGVIHKNMAARKKSRLHKQLVSLAKGAQAAPKASPTENPTE